METTFTPIQSLLGGGLIGLSAVLLMLTLGRIMGATGILAGFLVPSSLQEWLWRAAVLAGMVTGPLLFMTFMGDWPVIDVPVGGPMLMVGGVIVGVGVTLGSGCTSGHGVCGLARGSVRSLAATLVFMTGALSTVFIIRHVIGA